MPRQIGNYLLDEENPLGQGSDGTVYLARCVRTGERVAVKKIIRTMLSERARNHLATEIRVLKSINHPNIIGLRDSFEDPTVQATYLVMDHVDGSDLYEYIEKREASLTTTEVRWLLYQLLKALHYCHQNNIVHHDICLENVMIFTKKRERIDQDEYSAEALPANAQFCHIKLIDFGFCEEVQPGQLLDRFSGSEAYVAPEILEGEPYAGPPTDVWSVGVILYILLRGRFPFNPTDIDEHYEQATSIEYLASLLSEFDNSEEAEVYDLLASLFDPDPKARITLPEILAHPFLQGLGDVDRNMPEILAHPFFAPSPKTTTVAPITPSTLS